MFWIIWEKEKWAWRVVMKSDLISYELLKGFENYISDI